MDDSAEHNNSNTSNTEGMEVVEMNAESGRDSGLANEICSPRYHETNAKEKFLSSHKELQEAKQKLEELRLLRFEEKNYMKQEIDQLSEKCVEEELNSSNLERQLKKYNEEKIQMDKKILDLEREQSIGTQINMMQEQEIVRLEMRLKDEELQRYDVSRQLDQFRKAILEKDKQRMKQQSEGFLLKERIAQLEESATYYKNIADETQQKIWDIEAVNSSMNDEMITLRGDLEESRTDNANLTAELRGEQAKVTQLQEEAEGSQKTSEETKTNLEEQVTRCETLEEDYRKRELLLQQEVEQSTFNENKFKDKCEQTERLFHETRREKDEQIFELQRISDRVPSLEGQIEQLEVQKNDYGFLLSELRDVIVRHIRTDGKEDDDADAPSSLSTSLTKSPGKAVVKEVIEVTVEEIDEYFNKADIKMRSLQEQIITLSQQVEQEQSMMADLSTTIGSLRNELGRAQSNLTNNVKIKENIQEQYQQATETIKLQERNTERKNKENEHLRELIQDCERQLDHLKNELGSANTELHQKSEEQEKNTERKNKENHHLREMIQDYERQVDQLKSQVKTLNAEMLQNTATHKEEEIRLQLILQVLEKDVKIAREEKQSEVGKFAEESNSFKEIIENQNKELKDLKCQMEHLIEDNKNLAQRLMHLESYSDKLSEMLDKNQTADDKAREKFHMEIKEHRISVAEKEAEVLDLTRKIEGLNKSLHEKEDESEKKVKGLSAGHVELEEQAVSLRKEKEELEKKLQDVSEAHLTAEKSLVNHTEDNQVLDERCSEQLKLMEELHDRISLLENENASLKQSVSTMERGIRLKESLIAELSRKAGESSETYSTLKGNVQKAEVDKRHYENKLNILRHEKTILEKTIRETDDEKTYLKDQVANLQRLLAKSEDDKEVSLGSMAHYQSQLESVRAMKEKSALKDLEGQIQSLRVELNLERQRRERLETRYTKRDDQVSQLRSTFDQSLNTLSKDTKNIKSIIGKSLQKIDRIQDNEITDSDFVDTDSESFPLAKLNNSKYLSLPSSRTKSLEYSIENLTEKLKNGSVSSTPKMKHIIDKKYHSPTITAPKSTIGLSGKSLSLLQETPVRDEIASHRKSSKKLAR